MKFDNLYESLILELFSSTIKSHWSKVKNSFIASFTTGPEDKPTKQYTLDIGKSNMDLYDSLYQEDDEGLDYVDLTKDRLFQSFVKKNPKLPIYKITFEDIDYSPMKNDNGKSSFGITGEGNSIEVFSKVVGLLREFLSTNSLRVISFSASEPSRIKLYSRMVQRLAKELGYNHFQYNDINRSAHYILYK